MRKLLCARMVVETFLPFSFFYSCRTWQELMGLLTKETTAAFPALSSRRTKHLNARRHKKGEERTLSRFNFDFISTSNISICFKMSSIFTFFYSRAPSLALPEI